MSPAMVNRRQALQAALAAATLGVPRALMAQPNGSARVARLLVGFPPGGTADVLARALAPKLARPDAPMIVENKAGAGGRLAVTELLASPADGRTLLMTADPILVIYPHVFRNLGYRTETDIQPVAPVASEPLALVIGPMVPQEVKSLAQFVEWCKRHPNDASYATAAAGTTMHFLGAMLSRSAKVALVHVPHRGAAAALQDVMGGQIASVMTPLSQAIPQLGSGKLRVLAVSSAARARRLPDVPTFVELGHKDIHALVYYGIYLPAATPRPLVQQWHATVKTAAQSPAFLGTLDQLALDAFSMEQPAFAAYVRSDLDRWAPIVKATGYTADD